MKHKNEKMLFLYAAITVACKLNTLRKKMMSKLYSQKKIKQNAIIKTRNGNNLLKIKRKRKKNKGRRAADCL